jgi:predicted dithiol-disulfide oxidoreductase (DUF899 family)
MEHLRYPNESAEYRAARNALLVKRLHSENKSKPWLPSVVLCRWVEDYLFERIGRNSMPQKVTMSELFGRHNTLILYSFMYGPDRELPCPGCTHLLDGIDGAARQASQIEPCSGPKKPLPPLPVEIGAEHFWCDAGKADALEV